MAEVKDYLYRLRPVRAGMLAEGPTEAEERTLAAHFAYLQELTDRGVVLLAGRTLATGPETFGLVVFRAADEAGARSLMAGDPAVRDGVMTAELFPFRVALRARE